MSPFKILAIALGVAAAIGAVILALAAGQWTADHVSPLWRMTAMAFGAAALGLAIGGTLWKAAGVHGMHVERLVQHAQRLGEQGGAGQAPRLGFGLVQIPDMLEQAIGSLQQKVRQTASQRREFEVQVRILEAERRHLEAVINAISDAVVVTDAFNEIALANGSAARVLGFDLDRALHCPVEQAINDPTLVKLIKDPREGGNSSLRRHLEHMIGHNGTAAVYEVTMACVSPQKAEGRGERESSDGAAGVVTILHDVTREKEIAEMKSDFVSSVSHELRTPLSSIKAYVEMLIDGEAHDEQTRAEFYNIIQGETNRLSRLIDNILNISRIESGVTKVAREHIALPQLVREVVDIMQPQARAKNIELTQKPSPLYFQVFADRDMLLQATLNLLGNAIKYTPEGGEVTIRIDVDEHARQVQVSVIDTGIGIPESDLPHLFEKFYRVNDHKKVAKGTGLGLNLVKHVIETVHGGTVGVSSQSGVGSTFNYTLPIAENR